MAENKLTKLDIYQALNLFKINGRMRSVLDKKYIGVKKTEVEWKKELKSIGFDF